MILASGVSKGIGFSRAIVMRSSKLNILQSVKSDVKFELARVDSCIKEVDKELRSVCGNALNNKESPASDIMHKYIDIVNNQSLKNDIRHKIMYEETSAEHAIVDIMDGFSRNIRNLEDEYLHEKCEDIEEIKSRLLSKLSNNGLLDLGGIHQECIIVAHEITPKDILNMNPLYVKGIVTISPGPASSAGTVARELNIPMVTGAGSEGENIKDGDLLIVDGDRGKVIVNPDAHYLSEYGIILGF